MTRSQWILVGLITASSMSLVNARYQERRLFTLMDRVDRSSQKLESDIEVLEVELTALRNPARIDTAARRELKMVPLRQQDTLYYLPPAGLQDLRR